METSCQNRIPIVVGVTGHREISEAELPVYKEKVKGVFLELQARYPHTEIVCLSSLAAGADTICAEAALETGCKLYAPLPLKEVAYIEDFSVGEANVLTGLVEAAEEVFVATGSAAPRGRPDAADTTEKPVHRSHYYRQAGQYILAHSHLLLALWDGEDQNIKPGGTADVVRMARGRAVGRPVLWLVAPRKGREKPENAGSFYFMPGQEAQEADTAWLPCTALPALPIFEDIERFNYDVETHRDLINKQSDISVSYCLNGQVLSEDACARVGSLPGVYAAADTLSLYYQRKRTSSIRNLSLIGLFLVLTFLLYDETISIPALVCYGVLLIPAFFIFRFSHCGRWHARYMQYRLLAELLRTELFMRLAGDDYLPRIAFWRQERATVFAQGAVLPFAFPPPGAGGDLALAEQIWVDGQLDYHRSSKRKKGRQHRFNERAQRSLLAAAILVYLVGLTGELFAPGVMELPLLDLASRTLFADGLITWGALYKILLGTVFAWAAFLSNYYGKQGLPELIDSNEKMERLFAVTKQELTENANDEVCQHAVLTELADAHVEETVSWYLYNSRKNPELII